MTASRFTVHGPRFTLHALLLALFAAGCATTPSGRTPHATLSEGRIAQIDFGGVDLRFDLIINNPTERSLRLDAYSWQLLVGGRALAKGQSRAAQEVDPQTNLVVAIEASVRNGDVFRAIGSEHPATPPEYQLHAGCLMTSGLFNARPGFEQRAPLPVLYKPAVTLQDFRILKQTAAQATVQFDAALENHNKFPINLDTITASLNLAGRPVAQEFKTSPKSIPAGGKTVADFELDLDLSLLGPTVAAALRERDVSYEFSGTTAFDTPWGRKTLNFAQSGRLRIER